MELGESSEYPNADRPRPKMFRREEDAAACGAGFRLRYSRTSVRGSVRPSWPKPGQLDKACADRFRPAGIGLVEDRKPGIQPRVLFPLRDFLFATSSKASSFVAAYVPDWPIIDSVVFVVPGFPTQFDPRFARDFHGGHPTQW